jgi:hypothetical protein
MLRLSEGTTKATGLRSGGGEGFCRSLGGRAIGGFLLPLRRRKAIVAQW